MQKNGGEMSNRTYIFCFLPSSHAPQSVSKTQMILRVLSQDSELNLEGFSCISLAQTYTVEKT